MQSMVFRSSAEHQPSSSRAMRLPPQRSVSIYVSGTPVSVMSSTSRRQQQASQLAQVTSASCRVVASMVMNQAWWVSVHWLLGYGRTLCADARVTRIRGLTGVIYIYLHFRYERAWIHIPLLLYCLAQVLFYCTILAVWIFLLILFLPFYRLPESLKEHDWHSFSMPHMSHQLRPDRVLPIVSIAPHRASKTQTHIPLHYS